MTDPRYTEEELAEAEAELAEAEAGEDDPDVIDEAPTEELA